MTLQHSFDLIKAVEVEHATAGFSVARASDDIARDPSLLPKDLSPRDFTICRVNLERTYLVRMWAEFEGILRTHLHALRGYQGLLPTTKAERLINRIASRRKIPYDVLRLLHDVREYRNDMVHGNRPVTTFGLSECRSRMCKFLAYLPQRW